MTPPAPMTVEDIIFAYLTAGEDDKRAPQMRRELESMLLAAERRGEVNGMLKAKHICIGELLSDSTNTPEDIAYDNAIGDCVRAIQEKADSLSADYLKSREG